MICFAAMHAGILTDELAHEVIFTMEDVKKTYPCNLGPLDCTINGVSSQTKDNWDKGFIFEDVSSKANFFEDKYTGIPLPFVWEEFATTSGKKGGFEYGLMPDQSDYAIIGKKAAVGNPMGTKLI